MCVRARVFSRFLIGSCGTSLCVLLRNTEPGLNFRVRCSSEDCWLLCLCVHSYLHCKVPRKWRLEAAFSNPNVPLSVREWTCQRKVVDDYIRPDHRRFQRSIPHLVVCPHVQLNLNDSGTLSLQERCRWRRPRAGSPHAWSLRTFSVCMRAVCICVRVCLRLLRVCFDHRSRRLRVPMLLRAAYGLSGPVRPQLFHRLTGSLTP